MPPAISQTEDHCQSYCFGYPSKAPSLEITRKTLVQQQNLSQRYYLLIKNKELGLGQSMSRRGNCWDNAPQESFFGHFKDEIDMKSCGVSEDVKREIKSYITYYNHYRGQWNLKKMTPAQYRHYLLQVS